MTLALVGFGRKTGAISSKVTLSALIFAVLLQQKTIKTQKNYETEHPIQNSDCDNDADAFSSSNGPDQ
jgi:hypothetical protein